ncbi:MAG: 50S ribosomal protein L5 [Eggerthella sp. 51_9]|jgi:large subunit ribosomal protein L5|nr:MAG: 50S ribosomal protein L5 [Eggerthella sp. 51_9]
MATPRLKEKYVNEVRDQLFKELGLANVNQIPRLEKIVINMGVGRAAGDKKLLDGAIADLRTITGQQPMVTRAKKSIAGFHLREGQAIGCKVTLRGDRMWEFFDRLMSTALPRVRDFRGCNPNSFDGRGNYTMGLTEQLIFPEIEYDKIDRTRGMDITFVTTAENNEGAKALMNAMGFPFKKEN